MRSLSCLSYAVALAIAPAMVVATNFQTNCRNIRVGGINMSASCLNTAGARITNGVNMGDCIGVKADGTMQCGVDMDWQCTECWAVTVNSGPTPDPWVMSCKCKNSAGVYVRSDFNLGECFTNNNGKITC